MNGGEWKYLKECLDQNAVAAAGPFIQKFERSVADFIGVPHAVAASSGTAALHVALKLLNLDSSDAVLVPDFTFIAPVNAVLYCGAIPIFLDVSRETASLDPAALEEFVRTECQRTPQGLRQKQTGYRIRAILPVHLYGHPADLDPIYRIAEEFDLAVVEDAAECFGAKYKGRRVGATGRVAVFSFNGNKVITSGAGGMIVSSGEDGMARARHLISQARADSKEYIHDEVGFNYRMPSINAALGCAQIEGIEKCLERKRMIAARYARELETLPGLSTLKEASWAWSSQWLSTVFVDPEVVGTEASTIVSKLHEGGIEARRVWPPVHAQAPYRQYPRSGSRHSEWLYARGINLPSSVGLTEAEQTRVLDAVRQALPGGR
jgi:perosamine synthetase